MIALTLSVGLTDAGGKHMLPLQINIDAVNNSSIFLEVISGDNSHTVFFIYVCVGGFENFAFLFD